MLIRKSDLKRVISETVGRLNESHSGGSPCPIATANQLHASGASSTEVQDFIQQLLMQFSQAAAAEPAQVQTYQEFPQHGGVVGGVGF